MGRCGGHGRRGTGVGRRVHGRHDARRPRHAAVARCPRHPGPGVPVPAPGTELAVRRTGGLAGRTRERTVTLGELPDEDGRAWRSLLATDRLQGLAAAADRDYPDAYCYGVRCALPEVDVTVPEQVLSDDVRALLERTLHGGGTA
ncbi:hypothetical protein G7075_16660 [Phycicoccus sp. HDW14]|uniref:protealysin inhibitor emfourin n=1 Tax=Phycicoccus sp. HDW14 TaxID=2714941 RepID=UPI001409315A|nr:protealysin inhibitor emfourin [Phycicoccus sp. HDW14]QIM19877.1 hypothetical protein G7075_16660 [Phycicoccus sp. HDW14]